MRPSPVYAAAAAGAATAVAVLHRRRQARFFSSARGGFGRRVWSGGKSSPAPPWLCFAGEGPSCLFVGPIETASKEMLEALYDQARDSYYSGKPLIVDDMFDKVELKLRLYGSKCVVKYPRCSLRRQSAYADAEEDPSQVFTLASIWILLFAFGSFIFLIPTLYTIIMTYGDAMDESFFLNNGRFQLQCLHMLNTPLFMGLGFLIGYPIASASSQALKGLWRNDLVALKSSCPNCGEEVFAFVRAKQSNQDPHRAECHVCESSLVFRTKVECLHCSTSTHAGRKANPQPLFETLETACCRVLSGVKWKACSAISVVNEDGARSGVLEGGHERRRARAGGGRDHPGWRWRASRSGAKSVTGGGSPWRVDPARQKPGEGRGGR